jgi:hypothetical protein
MEDVFTSQAQRTSFMNQAGAGQDYGRGRSMNEK